MLLVNLCGVILVRDIASVLETFHVVYQRVLGGMEIGFVACKIDHAGGTGYALKAVQPFLIYRSVELQN